MIQKISHYFGALTLSDIISIAQALATIVIALVGAVWSYRLFWLKRQKYPRAKIEHMITHRALTENKVLLNVVTSISNNGDVLLTLEKGQMWIQQILPLPYKLCTLIDQGEDLVKILQSFVVSRDEEKEPWTTEIPWPLITSKTFFWGKGKREIEPGDSGQIRCDFILDQEIEIIKVYSFFENVAKRTHIGWDFATIYDMKSPERFRIEVQY